MQPNVPLVSEPSMAAYAQQLLAAASNASNAPATFGAAIHTPHSTAATINGGTPSQKDFAIALGVSQARISQLVKIGMPLSSIAAAKDWRVKRQRSSDDAALDALESAGSPDSGTAVEAKIPSISAANISATNIGAANISATASIDGAQAALAARIFASPR
jgi:hypothetical protein